MTNIKRPMPIDDCGCGRPVKITDRKKLVVKKIIKKR
jgi:hypothetical protein